MRIYVINLARSADRRAHMQTQLESLGLDYCFFDATDAAAGQLAGVCRYDERQALRRTGETLTPAELGCYASHYRLWQQCAAIGEAIVIMEDDVAVAPEFVSALGLAERRIDRHRFIRLAALWQRPMTAIGEIVDGHRLVRFHKGPCGTQCYMISPAGAQALLDHADVWTDAVDRYLDRFWTHGLASIAVLPLRVTDAQQSLPSVIGERRPGSRKRLRNQLRHQLMRFEQRVSRWRFRLSL